MGTKTLIEWSDSTWNPVTGCQHGCPYCYAKRIAERFGAGWSNITDKAIHELDDRARGSRMGKDGKPETKAEPYPYDFQPTLHRYRMNQPGKWVTARNIFVCSMADLFGDWVPDSWIDEVMASAQAADRHRYLFLTKNPKRYCQLDDSDRLPHKENWWYGSTWTKNGDAVFPGSCGTIQDSFKTFLSMEPLLEEPDLTYGIGTFDWVIIGAETGTRKDKVTPKREWVEKIADFCKRAGIPVFMKDSLIPIIGEKAMRREFPWHEDKR